MSETISGTYVTEGKSIDFVYLKKQKKLITSENVSETVRKLIKTEIGQN